MDHREAILARLVEIAAGVEGVIKAYRNKSDVPERQRPAIVIWDADEQADDGDPTKRPTNAPRRIHMSPEIYILLSGSPEGVGTLINQIRARFVRAVFSDASLKDMTFNGEGIRYEGCATGLARGRSMEGEMGVSISFTYRMWPDKL
ncbi:hypothetical protein [Pseudaminobacter soli (ex Li et al. 2025)]|uniref:Uncharacterized protein n=1 Tax=Pseudaminobacter soli (ex Li et al. 2025) TaxID=1295366 RepID=A0A2P7RZZ2_9HYPH|nr:hypothetical protein [Mesorhizobium soli]PSJ55764.1 hypothetical protein C7I85_26090 [Mesorhizobium soli]